MRFLSRIIGTLGGSLGFLGGYDSLLLQGYKDIFPRRSCGGSEGGS
jgi:hypothetical protein